MRTHVQRRWIALLSALLLAACSASGGAGGRFNVSQEPAVIDVPFEPHGLPPSVAGAAATTVSVSVTDLRNLRYDWVASAIPGRLLDAPLPIHSSFYETYHETPIKAANDVPRTIADALRGQLAAQGYRIGPDHADIRIGVIRFHEDIPSAQTMNNCFYNLIPETVSVVAIAAALVEVVDASDRPVFVKYYHAAHKVTPWCSPGQPIWAPSLLSLYRTNLIAAMRDMVGQIIGDSHFQEALAKGGRP